MQQQRRGESALEVIGGIVVVIIVIAVIASFVNKDKNGSGGSAGPTQPGESGSRPAGGSPALVDIRQTRQGNILIWTLRNKGVAGTVLLSVQQGNREWKFRTHFDAGEERTVRMNVPELGPAPYQLLMIFNPSQSELQNAFTVD